MDEIAKTIPAAFRDLPLRGFDAMLSSSPSRDAELIIEFLPNSGWNSTTSGLFRHKATGSSTGKAL
jgi:hypothetical protein